MRKIHLCIFAALVVLIACENPLDTLDRSNPADPKSSNFTPKDSYSILSYDSDLSHTLIIMYAISEYVDGFHLQKSLDLEIGDGTVWEDLGKVTLPERKYTDISKRYSSNTNYRIRSFKKIPSDTSYSSWFYSSINFSPFNSRLTTSGNNTYTWSKHHPLIETYHVYYTIASDPNTKRELTIIQDNKPTYGHTFSSQINDISAKVVVEGYVNDGEVWHMVTREIR